MKKSHNLVYQQENKHERSKVFVFTGYDNDKIKDFPCDTVINFCQ